MNNKKGKEAKEKENMTDEKMKIDAASQDVLEAVFAAADSDDSTESEDCPTVDEKKGE